MTATIPEIEVEYILWEAEDPFERPCEAKRFDCPNVALYRFFWVPATGVQSEIWGACYCGTQDLCLGCKDWVLGQTFNGVKVYKCNTCDGCVELKRVEPLRSRG
jgi:hypothetical protein